MAICFELRKPESLPWAEYYDTVQVLVHGSASGGGRSGPFVPPFSFPRSFMIVVTDDARRQLEGSGLAGLQFRKVAKERVSEFPWQDWVFGDKPLGDLFKSSGMDEPEDLVGARLHSPAVAEKVGDLWELTPPLRGKLSRRRERPVLEPELRVTTDFVRFDDDWEQVLVSERAKQWLKTRYDRWVSFRPRN